MSDRGFKRVNSFTLEADSSMENRSASRPVETVLGPIDESVIRDCVSKNKNVMETYMEVQRVRREGNRPLITQPAVKEFYDSVEETAAKERCVITGIPTKNYVDIELSIPGMEAFGNIVIPVCQPIAADMIQNGINASVTLGLMGNIQKPEMRVTEGKHLPVLSASKWHQFESKSKIKNK